MRIRRLDIKSFGHFADRALEFDGLGPHVILGPNEAGKTTLLHFLRGLLFGFPERSPYQFGDHRLEGSAELDFANGQRLRLTRKKGRPDRVTLTREGNPFGEGEECLATLLDHAHANLFSSVFGFGLRELAEGERELRHESIQSALFSGALSVAAAPERLMEDLDKRIAELFKTGGRLPLINKLRAEIETASKEARDHRLKAKDYLTLRDDLESAKERVDRAAAEQQQARSLADDLARRRKGLPLAQLRKQKWAQREALGSVPSLPMDARARFDQLSVDLARLDDDARELAADAESLTSRLGQLPTDADPFLEHATTIESLHASVVSVTNARRDLPEVQRELEQERARVSLTLAELRPGWNDEQLASLVINEVSRSALLELAEQRRQLDERQKDIEREEGRLVEDEAMTRSALAALPPTQDHAELAVLAEEEPSIAAARKEMSQLERALSQAETEIARGEQSLFAPLRAEPKDPTATPVPRKETVVSYRKKWDAAERDRERRAAELEEARKTLARHEADRASLSLRGEEIPSPEELARRRASRDEQLEALRSLDENARSKQRANPTQDDPRDRWESIQRAIRSADDYADLLFRRAADVSRMQEIDAQIARWRENVATIEGRVSSAAEHIESLRTAWKEEWRPSGLTPLEPEAMEGWLSDFHRYAEVVARQSVVRADLDRLRSMEADFHTRLARALSDSESPVATLIHRLKERLREAVDNDAKRIHLQETLQQRQQRRDANETRRAQWVIDENDWQERWARFLEKLDLPREVAPRDAERILERLRDLRETNLRVIPERLRRIEAMKNALERFDPEATRLIAALAPDLADRSTEVAVAELQRRLVSARENRSLRLQTQERLALCHRQRESWRVKRTALEAKRREMLGWAEASDESTFLSCVDRCEAARSLDAALAELKTQLAALAGAEELDAFEARVLADDSVTLDRAIAEQAIRVQSAERSLHEAHQRLGALQRDLERLDGAEESARAESRLAHQRARLVHLVDQAAPMILARHLLEEAVVRFNRDNQPALLADVTRLFSMLTAERYVAVERPPAAREAMIVRLKSGEARTPDQLSAGTREQLYLAIRLAYVRRYCAHYEPLPIVMDDVLANSDDQRARRAFETMREMAPDAQIIYLTCHPHLLECARTSLPELSAIELDPSSSGADPAQPPSPRTTKKARERRRSEERDRPPAAELVRD